jgi:hypothetical protein
MVFSPEYNQRLGTAKIIQCKAAVSSIEDLVLEATELWGAETKKTDQAELCAKWGCITLLAPDDFLSQPDGKRRQALLEAWRERVAQNRSYGKLRFSAKDRQATGGPVIANAQLRIGWPTHVDGRPIPFDLLLATATEPSIEANGNYPTVEAIAAAWNKNGHVYYFRCNRFVGIQTADDEAIQKLLRV